MLSLIRSALMMVVGAVIAVSVLTLPTRAADEGKALEDIVDKLQRKVKKLEAKLKYVEVAEDPINGLAGPHLIIEGCNVHVRSGSGDSTDGTVDLTAREIIPNTEPLGLGNLIVGYNEPSQLSGPDRGGSHNLIVGPGHSYTSVGGAVVAHENRAKGPFTSVTGGFSNEAAGYGSSITAGDFNTTFGNYSCISGGILNRTSGAHSSVSGGYSSEALGYASSVSGGDFNKASGRTASVIGGSENTASGESSSVSSGHNNVASGKRAGISAGGNNSASGESSSVTGGGTNSAEVLYGTVGGGQGGLADINAYDWDLGDVDFP